MRVISNKLLYVNFDFLLRMLNNRSVLGRSLVVSTLIKIPSMFK